MTGKVKQWPFGPWILKLRKVENPVAVQNLNYFWDLKITVISFCKNLQGHIAAPSLCRPLKSCEEDASKLHPKIVSVLCFMSLEKGRLKLHFFWTSNFPNKTNGQKHFSSNTKNIQKHIKKQQQTNQKPSQSKPFGQKRCPCLLLKTGPPSPWRIMHPSCPRIGSLMRPVL